MPASMLPLAWQGIKAAVERGCDEGGRSACKIQHPSRNSPAGPATHHVPYTCHARQKLQEVDLRLMQLKDWPLWLIHVASKAEQIQPGMLICHLEQQMKPWISQRSTKMWLVSCR